MLFPTGEIFPELYTTTASLDDEEEPPEPEEEVPELEECEPSPSARPALSALPPSSPGPKEGQLTLDSQYYR